MLNLGNVLRLLRGKTFTRGSIAAILSGYLHLRKGVWNGVGLIPFKRRVIRPLLELKTSFISSSDFVSCCIIFSLQKTNV